MKRLFAIILLSSLAAIASADTVNVNLNGIPTLTDITLPNMYQLGGVNFSYDNFGSTDDTAALQPGFIGGSTYGALVFGFDNLVTKINFNFSLLGAAASEPGSQNIDDALVLLTFLDGNYIDDELISASFQPYDSQADPYTGDVLGSLAFAGQEFNQVVFYFSTLAPVFRVTDISFETAQSVPEPATILILTLGIFSLVNKKKRI
jgi:hypothetical protein